MEDMVQELQPLMHLLPGFENVDRDDTQEWLQSDEQDPGYQILLDEEIVDSIINPDTNDAPDDETDENNNVPSRSEAYNALELAMSWLENQPDFNFNEFILLKKIRDNAAQKRYSKLVQKKLEDYFES